jgi:hypothetical protein
MPRRGSVANSLDARPQWIDIYASTAGGESGLQADVLTYSGGKLVKAVSIADTALQERVFGTK